MINIEKRDGQRLQRARIATALISVIAISAIALAFYAFEQKKKAENQTNLAMQRAVEAMQEQQNASQQRIIADSNKEQAMQQSEIAQANARSAIEQKQRADSEAIKSKKNELIAEQKEKEANTLTNITKIQADSLKDRLEEIKRTKARADTLQTIATDANKNSNKLTNLADSRKLANESILLLNQNLVDSSKHVALQAYHLNKDNNGPVQSNDIYNALNANWTKSINYRNQAAIHLLPVHCITGYKSNTIFTADESGLLVESIIKNNGLQKVASYPVKEEIRALCTSPDDSKLAAITSNGDGFIFSITSSNIALQKTFKFQGIGKDASFDSKGDLIVLSNKGLIKFESAKMPSDDFIAESAINVFMICKNGKMYVGNGSEIDIYNSWNDVVQNLKSAIKKFDSKVTSVAIDNSETFLAVGTYNGFVSLIDLKSNNEVWSRGLHSSSVNALKFNTVDHNILQLASAGSDQVIRLINVNAILQKNFDEDIITLKGHTKWIYDLYYTPDGEWLFSTGEDNKVIGWKTTMKDLYLTLNTQ